jgi:Zn-dependent protease
MWELCYHITHMDVNFIFSIVILIMSVVVHEVSHGYAADALGDPTPRLQGRLTLNPLKHLDLFGSVLFPALSYMVGGIIFGWAKPVMINPYNLKARKWGEAIVAFAGPLSNILLAVVFSMLIRFASPLGLSQAFVTFSMTIVVMNIVLAIFNLIPIPPLDGSKILFAILPARFMHIRMKLEQYGFMIVLLFIIFMGSLLNPIINFLLNILVG